MIRVAEKPERPKGLYERLLAERDAQGVEDDTPVVAAPHSEESARSGEGGASVSRNVIFCADQKNYGEYVFFTHEADVLLIAAAGEVESGKLTPAEARELLEPYREALAVIFTGEQRMVFDPDRIGWTDTDGFPSVDDVQQSPPASQVFWYEADAIAIEGAGFSGWSGSTGPVFSVQNEEALEALREAVAGGYKIVVKADIGDYHPPDGSVEWALRTIRRAREE